MVLSEHPNIGNISDIICAKSFLEPKEDKNANRDLFYYELIFRLDVTDKIEYREKTYIAGPDTVMFFPRKKEKDAPLYVETLTEGKFIIIYFTVTTPFSEEPILINTTSHPEIKRLFTKINTVWSEKREHYYLNAMHLFYEILYKLQTLPNHHYYSKESFQKLEPAIQYIHTHYQEQNFSYQELHTLCQLSYTYFHRLFSAKTGTTPVKYVTSLKMKRALDFLFTKDYSIEQISKMLGYESVYYFSRVFKNYYGCAPSRYYS